MFLSVKIARSGDIPHLCAIHIGLNTQSITDYTNSNTTEIWFGTAKLISRQTLYDSKLWKANSVCIFLNVLTTKMTIKWTATTVFSGNTDLTVIGITKSLKSSEKSEPIQFAQV